MLWANAGSRGGPAAVESAREGDRYLNLAAGAQELHRHLVGMPVDHQIDAGLAELQVAQHDLVEKLRQARIAQAYLADARIELQSQRRLDQRERRRARPGLRGACDRIECRPAAASALKSAE